MSGVQKACSVAACYYKKLITRHNEKKENIEFHTEITEEKRCVTWKIDNINLCPFKTGEYLQSPTFITGKTALTKWALRLYPKGKDIPDLKCSLENPMGNSECVGIYICLLSSSARNSIACKFDIIRNFQHIGHFDFEQICDEDTAEYGKELPIEILMHEKKITLKCTLTVGYLDSSSQIQNDKIGYSTGNCITNLIGDLKELAENPKFTDVTLEVDKKRIPAHKCMLSARSKVFSAMFEHDMKESETSVVKIEDLEPLVFQNVLYYIYTGKIDDLTLKKAIKMYPVADKYAIAGLQKLCLQVMFEKMAVENVCRIISLADMHSEKKLKEAANYFFRNYSKQIFETKDWKALVTEKPQLASEIIATVVSDFKTKLSTTSQLESSQS